VPGGAAPTVGAVGPSLASAPLDLARLAGIAGEDTAFMRELLVTFRASASSVVGEMQDALPALDRDRLRRSAHKLRGASENIGAARLRDLAALVESGAGERSREDLAGAIGAISSELGELDRFFSSTDLATFSRQLAS
ncbi:MAG: Hpt domain-containing protein, partial [Steroidobacteraceae bacterium]